MIAQPYPRKKGDKVIAITDNHGYACTPVPVAPVNETDMVLFPEGLKALKKVAKEVSMALRGADLNLDGGVDSPRNRKLIFRVERTFAWEDKCKRLLLRFERIQQRHYGMKLMVYTLMNLRSFCGV